MLDTKIEREKSPLKRTGEIKNKATHIQIGLFKAQEEGEIVLEVGQRKSFPTVKWADPTRS